MTDLHFTTISGADTVVKEDIVNAFKATFRGDTLFPGDESYEEARKVWNGMINK